MEKATKKSGHIRGLFHHCTVTGNCANNHLEKKKVDVSKSLYKKGSDVCSISLFQNVVQYGPFKVHVTLSNNPCTTWQSHCHRYSSTFSKAPHQVL